MDNTRFGVYLTPQQLTAVKAIATHRGDTISAVIREFMRIGIMEAVASTPGILEDHRETTVSDPRSGAGT